MAEDLVLRAFMSAMWIISFLALFGVEARQLFVYPQFAVYIYLLAVSFVISTICLNYVFVRRLFRPAVLLNGRIEKTSLREAPAQISHLITERARKLGITTQLRVFIVPYTSGKIDAYVWSWLGHYNLALSSKAAQFGLLRGEQRRRFEILVDHELGHVRNRNSGILYQAKALFWATLILVPVKLFTISVFWFNNLLFLERLFPSRWNILAPSGLYRVLEGHAISLVALPTRLPTSIVVGGIFLYNFGTLLILYALFRVDSKTARVSSRQVCFG